MTAEQHRARLALLRLHTSGRKQTRAADDFYDRILVATGNDPESMVAQAAGGVFARVDAGAVSEAKGAVQLAALLAAWRTVR